MALDDPANDPADHSTFDPMVPSPCVRLCTLDDDAVCVGCFRSLDEIKDWGRLDGPGRRAVLAAADRRRAAAPARPGWFRPRPTPRG